MTQLATREERLHGQLVTAATDAQETLRLSRELDELHTEREQLEIQWLEAAELADP
ncbi:MAG: hypothetical protein H0U62_01120 [Actinobacteria bacterium]|nr:hypothetical protein [Actinomycetota bacterium]